MLDILLLVQALIDSKKLQEKGVGEKFQPRESIAQSQFQEKHVAMVNQSEASFFDFWLKHI